MVKGTASFGKKSGKKFHIACRRCGRVTYHVRNNVCSSCGYGKTARWRTFAWQKK